MALDKLPLSVMMVLTLLIIGLPLAAGLLLGRSAARAGRTDARETIGITVSAVTGLLSLLLAFTFGIAADKHSERKRLVLLEANAIGTTYLRARLLPEPESSSLQRLLRDYTQRRVDAVSRAQDLSQMVVESENMQRRMWQLTENLAHKHPESEVVGTFIISLNEMIDAQESRIQTGMRDHIPAAVWLVICIVAALAMLATGYHAGLTGVSRPVGLVVLTVAFCVVIMLIADLNQPGQGLLLVSQDPTRDVLNSIIQTIGH